MGDAAVDVLVVVGEMMAVVGGVWLFGTSGPQTYTPSENSRPL